MIVSGFSLARWLPRSLSAYIVDWADLVTLDLSLSDTPGGKEKLAEQLRDAVQNIGNVTVLSIPSYVRCLMYSHTRGQASSISPTTV